MNGIEFAKVYIRSLTAITCLTTAIVIGAYLGQVTETIWAAYITGTVACVVFDRPILPTEE